MAEPQLPEVIDTYTEGDTLPIFTRTYEGGEDITGWTITLQMRREDETLLTKTATITDGVAGEYQFTFAAADLIEGERQPAEIVLDDGAGGIQTQSNLFFTVRANV